MKLILLIFLISRIQNLLADKPCAARQLKFGTVCVCNQTYCDTISPPGRLERPKFIQYTSSKAGLRFHKENGEFSHDKLTETSKNVIRINGRKRYQKIEGWGGCFTDATVFNWASLHPSTQQNILKSYFSSHEGIGYNLCRIPIGSNDFSTRNYVYIREEVAYNLSNFKLAPEDFKYRIPFIKSARKLSENKLKLFASAWTAPKLFKTNKKYAGFGFLVEEHYQNWADYFIKFLDSYNALGLEFWGITTGNEPSLAYSGLKINSVAWTPKKLGKWVAENLGPTLRNSSYSRLKLMALDDQIFTYPWAALGILRVKEAAKYIDGFAIHGYYDKITPPQVLDYTHWKFPAKFMLSTEFAEGLLAVREPHVAPGSWKRGRKYAENIIENLKHWSSGWVDWNMSLDMRGGPNLLGHNVDSPILVDRISGEFYKQPMLGHWLFVAIMGHFSKFIPAGSVRIGAREFSRNVRVVAMEKLDGGKTIVILNKKSTPIEVSLIDEDFGGILNLKLSQHSISTVLYW